MLKEANACVERILLTLFPTSKHVKWTGFVLLVAFIAVVLPMPDDWYPRSTRTILQVFMALITLGWIASDARERSRTVPPLYVGAAAVLPYVALPVWLVQTRGVRKAARSAIVAALLYLACVVAIVFFYKVLGVKISK